MNLKTVVALTLTLATPIVAFAQATTSQEPPLPPDCSAAKVSTKTSAPIDCTTLAAIDAAAQQIVSAGYSPGVAVGVMRGGQMLFSGQYGKQNLETDTPVSPATVFPIFSITKMFTAAGILQLRDAGRLSLDDKLAKFFPDFPRGNEVSLRHLLSHTSGIHDHVGGAPDGQRLTLDQLMVLIRSQTPLYDFDPGTKYSYSNSNYSLLGKIIEMVSGRPYRNYIRDSIVGRVPFLQMAVDSRFDVVPGRASGYLRTTTPGRFANGAWLDPSFTFAAGSMRSTIADLALWFHAFFDGRVLNQVSVREMTTASRLTDGSVTGGSWGAYGLGTELSTVDGHRTIGHGGATASFTAAANYYPDDDFMLFVFANTGRTAGELEMRIARIIFAGATRAK